MRSAPAPPSLRRRGRRRAGGPLSVALALLVLAACLGDEGAPADAVARLGDRWVSGGDLDQYLSQTAGSEAGELDSDVLSQLLDQFLDEELLARLAVEEGVASPEDSRRRAADRLLRSGRAAEPTAGEIESYYREHREEFERPERVRLSQILVADRYGAERALEELGRGQDFAEVARRASVDSGELGGDQGELARDDLPPAFIETIFALEPGEISGIVEADYGFHIFMVTERLPAQVVPLDAAAEEIRLILRERAMDHQLEDFLGQARGRYEVAIVQQNLPFDYQGRYRVEDL